MKYAIGILCCILAFSAAAEEAALTHPGITHNQKELDFVKKKIASGAEPQMLEKPLGAAIRGVQSIHS